MGFKESAALGLLYLPQQQMKQNKTENEQAKSATASGQHSRSEGVLVVSSVFRDILLLAEELGDMRAFVLWNALEQLPL